MKHLRPEDMSFFDELPEEEVAPTEAPLDPLPASRSSASDDAQNSTGSFEFPEERPRESSGFIPTVLLALLLALALRVFVGEPFKIPSGSMLETIQVGDLVWGERVSYRFRKPVQGEIVTFNDPKGSGDILIKRVIATEGHVIDLVDGVVYVDGEALEEPYTNGSPSYPLMPADFLAEEITYPYEVPQDCVWVMGDNRQDSADSRHFGPVRVSQITSRAVVVYWPPQDMQLL